MLAILRSSHSNHLLQSLGICRCPFTLTILPSCCKELGHKTAGGTHHLDVQHGTIPALDQPGEPFILLSVFFLRGVSSSLCVFVEPHLHAQILILLPFLSVLRSLKGNGEKRVNMYQKLNRLHDSPSNKTTKPRPYNDFHIIVIISIIVFTVW